MQVNSINFTEIVYNKKTVTSSQNTKINIDNGNKQLPCITYNTYLINFSSNKILYPVKKTGSLAGINECINEEKDTLLIKYSKKNNIIEVKKLLKYINTDVNKGNKYGTTPLMIASAKGHLKIVKELLKHKDININAQNCTGDTALMHAVMAGKLKVVKELLKNKGINVNIENNYGQTALMLAYMFSYDEIIKELTKQKGINLNYSLIK